MLEKLTTNWTIWRFLRLGIAIFLLAESIARQEWLLTALGGIILYQVLFNIGCAGGACAIPDKKIKENNND